MNNMISTPIEKLSAQVKIQRYFYVLYSINVDKIMYFFFNYA